MYTAGWVRFGFLYVNVATLKVQEGRGLDSSFSLTECKPKMIRLLSSETEAIE